MYDIIGGGKIGDNHEQLTLGELQEKLLEFNFFRYIRFVGTEYSPSGTSCYRGSYDELAINYSTDEIQVGQFCSMLKDTLSKTYIGYKGGEYKMRATTPLWVGRDSSHYSQMAIVSVFLSEDGVVYLGTRFKD